MEKELFQKLAENLSNKYSKDELARLLVKNKDRKISKLIASAYNKKSMHSARPLSTKDLSASTILLDEFDKRAIEYFERKRAVIGPSSWIYDCLENTKEQEEEDKSWSKFLKDIKYVSLEDYGTLDRILTYMSIEAFKRLRS